MSEYLRKARNTIKNNKAAYLVSTTVAACTALVLFARGCETGGSEGLVSTVRGDGICHESESYPYKRDKNTGQVMKDDKGVQVKNPSYSKEDCFYGDNVWDSDSDSAKVKDPVGNNVQWDPALIVTLKGPSGEVKAIRYHSGKTITFPLENETSLDSMLTKLRENPCAEYAPGSKPVERDPFRFPIGVVDERTRQRTQEEIASMHAHPEALRTGGNYFTVYIGYEESCDVNLPTCTPDTATQCYCPNIKLCASATPVPKTCGNGNADNGEACDYKNKKRARGGCQEGYSCSRSCQCTQNKSEQKCGDNKKEGSEECDGTDSSSCGPKGRCASGCLCEDDVEPASAHITGCPGEISGPISGAVASQVNRDPGTVRTAAYAQGGQAVVVSYSARVDPPGVISAPSVTLSCSGCAGGTFSVDLSRVVVSAQQPCIASGRFSLAGE
jgi:hypothetical protein